MPDAPDTAAQLVTEFDQLKEDIAFIRALKQLRIVTSAGDITLRFDPATGNISLDLRALTPSATTPATVLPSQTGHAGQKLTTDGSTLSWTA
jgi:hypothetical protein